MLVVLGGSWVVIRRVISRVTIHITPLRGLITPLITTHEPPSRAGLRSGFGKPCGCRGAGDTGDGCRCAGGGAAGA